MTPDLLERIAEEANLAPSAHNTQPTRWQADGDNAILLSLEQSRLLPIGDPQNKDARLSGGAALYGTILALARNGKGASGWEADGDRARIELSSEAGPVLPAELLKKRTTYRAGFEAPSNDARKALKEICASRDDAALTQAKDQIEALSEWNDQASLAIMRAPDFRQELLDWMRLSRSNPRWDTDGLSAQALAMSGLEARAAGLVLRRPVFELIDRVGFAKAVVSEHSKTVTATGLVAFHRPIGEDRWTSGGRFYDFWIALTQAGFAAWPMAVLADNAAARQEVMRLYQLPDDRDLITVLRVGPHPGNRQPPKARLAAHQLLIEA